MEMPGEEAGCVIEIEEEEDEEYDAAFLELGSGHEDEEEDDEEEDEEDEGDEDDDGEVDDVASFSSAPDPPAAVRSDLPSCSSSSSRRVEYVSDEAELMGAALEALPELHSPDHNKYVLDGQMNSAAEDEEAVMDAISKRTRAHYSLADMTLDQLETFLQESDEDDYFHNVDDEDEYRKFLAAVAQPATTEAEVSPEDEDDDADFEVEIQEALESDSEQHRQQHEQHELHQPQQQQQQQQQQQMNTRRPETRELRRERPETRELRRERMQCKERPLGIARTPLRPLVPYHVETPAAMVTSTAVMSAGQRCMQTSGLGFLPQQIGQLHCLIHEHVQLLVQVFSMCILEPSRQQAAIDTHRMLMELVVRREAAASFSSSASSVSYPDFCFRQPFVRASPGDEQGEPSWTPSVPQPVHSVLSVTPLESVKEFLDDVAAVVQDYKQKHVQTGSFNIRCEREPLFPLPDDSVPRAARDVYPCQTPKKSLAAILVENTKKQIVALVPKGLVTAASRFVPFFNPGLYPHKPPPPATANRLLFTDAEDELLAMGLMTFNTDWKAIQNRYLPTKSTHQIFVRQKNRTSSRAPENSIKAVRRMKNSSLTPEERDSIQEALKCFKYDWNKVWQHVVPHRDPALLPRQWRTALGTQKSYKSDEITKGKRRIHEAGKRRMKALQKEAELQEEDLGGTDGRGEVTNGEDDAEELHIHEAFLRPTSNPVNHLSQPRLSPAKAVHALSTATGSSSSPRKRSRSQTVKLAPGLPSLNLPAHVRVISQSAPQAQARHPAGGCYPSGSGRNVHTGSVHPLLLEPSYYTANQLAGQSSSSPSQGQHSMQRQAPTFHPFFGVPQNRFQTAVIPNAASNFHPLLEKPLENFAGQSSSGRDSAPENEDESRRKSPRHLERSYPDAGWHSKLGDDVVMEHEELGDSRDEVDAADQEVHFECEEIDDSDREDFQKQSGEGRDIEFEEEEIGSESESELGQAKAFPAYNAAFALEADGGLSPVPANGKAPNLSRASSAQRSFSAGKEADVTAIEAAHVLAKFLRN